MEFVTVENLGFSPLSQINSGQNWKWKDEFDKVINTSHGSN